LFKDYLEGIPGMVNSLSVVFEIYGNLTGGKFWLRKGKRQTLN